LGKNLYDKIIAHIKLLESDYFGLQFTDTYHVKVGLLKDNIFIMYINLLAMA